MRWSWSVDGFNSFFKVAKLFPEFELDIENT